jgi:hypothetical protein
MISLKAFFLLQSQWLEDILWLGVYNLLQPTAFWLCQTVGED